MRDIDRLYIDIECALSHNLDVCGRCKKCKGKDAGEIRMNLIRDLAEYMGKELPWREENEK